MNNNIKNIFISFLITFVLLFPIATIILTNLNDNSSYYQAQNANTTEYIIPKERDLNLLLVIGDKDKNADKIFSIIKISPHDNTIGLSFFEPSVVTVVGTKTSSLNDFLDYGGYDMLKKALETLTSIEIDRFISTDDDGVTELINSLSGVEITLSDNLTYKNINLQPGYQLLDGSRFVAVLHKSPLQALISLPNGFSKLKSLSYFFETVSDVCSTDISAYDFEINKSGFEQMIKNNNATLLTPAVDFENVLNRQKLTQSSLNELEEVYSK